jgi:beta-lactamase class A
MRILYNASYLEPELSERALTILTEAEFSEGVAKKLPSSVPVAHKFGERLLDNEIKQLHDCGIVYFPQNPYVLCVMTKGQDWEKLAQTIQDVSKMVYDEVNSRKINE